MVNGSPRLLQASNALVAAEDELGLAVRIGRARVGWGKLACRGNGRAHLALPPDRPIVDRDALNWLARRCWQMGLVEATKPLRAILAQVLKGAE